MIQSITMSNFKQSIFFAYEEIRDANANLEPANKMINTRKAGFN